MADRQVYELTGRTLALTDVIPTQAASGATEAGKNTIQEVKDLIAPYKYYAAIINQVGTGAPTISGTAISTFTGTITFGYDSVGVFSATSANSEFTANKTLVFFGNGLFGGETLIGSRQNSALISFSSKNGSTAANDLIETCSIQIFVYS